jgi:hypothetical protein
VPGRASGPSRSRVDDGGGSRCVSGKVIGCLGFSYRGVFIGEGAASEVDQGPTPQAGAGQGQAAPLVVWPPCGSFPSLLRFSGSFGKYLDVWLLFRPIPRIFSV